MASGKRKRKSVIPKDVRRARVNQRAREVIKEVVQPEEGLRMLNGGQLAPESEERVRAALFRRFGPSLALRKGLNQPGVTISVPDDLPSPGAV